jgi:hypothetical protein
MKLLAQLSETERTDTRKVLDGWPKEPPNRESAAIGKSSSQAAANTMRVLHRELAILRMVDGPDAVELATQLDRLGPDAIQPVTELARKIRTAMRRQLADVYRSANPERQALMGWAVDPDDVPAFPQAGTPGSPNPELVYQRGVEKDFHDWLATNRYAGDAKLFGASPLKPLQTAAIGYRNIVQLYTDPFR